MDVWQELRETLIAELGDLIGSYKIRTATGEVQNLALHFAPPQVPQDRRVEGLEVIVWRSPTDYEATPLSGRDLATSRTYTLFLIQHDPSTTAEAAVTKLLQTFPDIKVTPIPGSDRAPEQIKITLTEAPKRLKRKL